MQEYGKSLTGVQLSEDGECIIVQSDVDNGSIRRWYRFSGLTRGQGTWNALEFHPQEKLDPIKQVLTRWENEPLTLSDPDTSAYLFWQVDQNPRHPYPDIPIMDEPTVLCTYFLCIFRQNDSSSYQAILEACDV